MKKKSTRRGFTLLELLVVVLIIGILASVALPQYRKAVAKARAVQVVSFVRTMQQMVEILELDTPSCPSGCEYCDIRLTGEDGGVCAPLYELPIDTGLPKGEVTDEWEVLENGVERYGVYFPHSKNATFYWNDLNIRAEISYEWDPVDKVWVIHCEGRSKAVGQAFCKAVDARMQCDNEQHFQCFYDPRE